MDPFLSSVHDTQHSTINREEPQLGELAYA